MEFGKVTTQELERIDFSLPPDPAVTKETLKTGKGNTAFYIGCAKWGRADWVGSLYPPGTKDKDFLKYYGRIFNAIEFNGFYYNLPPKEQVMRWRDTVPEHFLFCPKFTQYITHIRRLKDVDQEVAAFVDVISAFGDKLGPVFLMPNPNMTREELFVLEAFINAVPDHIKLFLELRHESWYRDSGHYHSGLLQYLQHKKTGTVITDAAGRRDCVHMHLTTPECFIRFTGNSLHPTDYRRIDDWVDRIKIWMDAGLEKCYFFMHQHDELHSPQLIRYFIERLNEKCGTHIKAPVMHQQTLF